MLQVWNSADPPTTEDRRQNDAIEALQGTRNPFINQPEFDRQGANNQRSNHHLETHAMRHCCSGTCQTAQTADPPARSAPGLPHNVGGDSDFLLVIAWALAVLRDKGPFRILKLLSLNALWSRRGGLGRLAARRRARGCLLHLPGVSFPDHGASNSETLEWMIEEQGMPARAG